MFCLYSLHLKQTFQPMIWILTEFEGDGIESRLHFKISTLRKYFFKTFVWLKFKEQNELNWCWQYQESRYSFNNNVSFVNIAYDICKPILYLMANVFIFCCWKPQNPKKSGEIQKWHRTVVGKHDWQTSGLIVTIEMMNIVM